MPENKVKVKDFAEKSRKAKKISKTATKNADQNVDDNSSRFNFLFPSSNAELFSLEDEPGSIKMLPSFHDLVEEIYQNYKNPNIASRISSSRNEVDSSRISSGNKVGNSKISSGNKVGNSKISSGNKVGNYKAKHFANPGVKSLRKYFVRVLSCFWCWKLFKLSDEPRFHDSGETVCSKCLTKFYKENHIKMNKVYPLNTSYISAIHNIHKEFKIFNSYTPHLSELERALTNENSDFGPKSELFSDSRKKLYYLIEITGNFRSFKENSQSTISKLLNTMETISELKSHYEFSTMKNLSNSLLDTIEHLEKNKNVLNLSFERIGNKQDWLIWNNYFTVPSSIHFSQQFIFNILEFGMETILFKDEDNRRLFSTLHLTAETLTISAFSTKLPAVPSFGMVNIRRFDLHDLKCINTGYFDLSIENRELSEYSLKEQRFYIMFNNMDCSYQTAYLFAGYKSACFLGAEIEVTKDKVIFHHYIQYGRLCTKNIMKPLPRPEAKELKPVVQGMIISESESRVNMITIFKYDDPSKKAPFVIGRLNTYSVARLLKLPIGSYTILDCGISSVLSDNFF